MEGRKDLRLVVPITEPDQAGPEASDQEQPHISASKRRHATVYDVVAGKSKRFS